METIQLEYGSPNRKRGQSVQILENYANGYGLSMEKRLGINAIRNDTKIDVKPTNGNGNLHDRIIKKNQIRAETKRFAEKERHRRFLGTNRHGYFSYACVYMLRNPLKKQKQMPKPYHTHMNK